MSKLNRKCAWKALLKNSSEKKKRNHINRTVPEFLIKAQELNLEVLNFFSGESTDTPVFSVLCVLSSALEVLALETYSHNKHDELVLLCGHLFNH